MMQRTQPTDVYAQVVSPYPPPSAPDGQVNHYHYVTMVPRPAPRQRRILTSYTPAQAAVICAVFGLLAALCGLGSYALVISLLAATP